MSKKRITTLTIAISLVLLVIVFCLGLMVGRYNISLNNFFKALFSNSEAYQLERSIIINLRLPRTIVAGLSGIALSLSGLLYQETFQNNLVSPDLLGVSNGAGVGAALAIVLGLSSIFITSFAFIFGIVTVILSVTISRLFKNSSSTILLLSGIIVGGLMSSILSLIKYFADAETTLSDITYWLMGSFADSTMKSVYVLLPIVVISSVILIIIRFRINVVALGKEEAQTNGINYKFYRLFIILIATLLTAVTVAFSGTISWIGLVIPHIVRLLVGKNTSYSIPVSICFGSIFMIVVDILSRVFTSNEIPLSAVTGLFGTVVFIIILISRRRIIKEND